jgi:hypothetical protein
MQTIETVILRQQLIEDVAQLVSDNFGLRDYQKADLVQELSTPNFFEFWFSGGTYGSFKLFVTTAGTPYIFDQNKTKTHKKLVDQTNAAFVALVEQFQKDYAAFSN